MSDTGWVWVPGATWAPAWVSWRQSDDYVGWAPLPPDAEFGRDFRIEGWADTYYNIGPTSYVFIKTADLANKSYRDLIVSPRDNLDIISRTKNVTNIAYGNAGVIDNGPNYDQLVQRSNVKIDRYRLNYVQQSNPEAQFSATTRGDRLEVVAPAPRLQRAATVEPKTAGDITKAQVDRGWQNIDETRAKQLKQTWARQAPVPASIPAKPAPPKPLFVRAAGQGASQQPNPPSATQQSNQRLNNETTVAPAPSRSLNEKAAPSGQQPPGANENQRQELKQGERPETTPPAPNRSPSLNEKAARSGQQPSGENENQRQEKQGERSETTPPAPSASPDTERSVQQSDREEASPKQNRRQEQGQGERAQPTPSRAESAQSKNERPAQAEERGGKG